MQVLSMQVWREESKESKEAKESLNFQFSLFS
jgi:hypothetical protein